MDSLALRASNWSRRVRRRWLTAKARLRGKTFFCKALTGDSKVNLSINSDLTVSCSCHDVDGSGRIGDLKSQSLRECFSGPVARRFREDLATGRLPIADCARCRDLRMTGKEEARRFASEYHLPRYVMLENTSACNLRCVSCPRARIRELRSQVSMSLEDVRKVAAELKDAGVERVAYLNFGEPFLSKAIGRELEIVRQLNPGIRIDTSTNGLLLDTDEKRDAALRMDRIQFSLDGTDQKMAVKYQRGLDFEKAYENMKALAAYRDARGLTKPAIVWKYLLFRWNDRKADLRRAIDLAREACVDEILFERTVSPFYGLPLRSYLGFHNDIGEELGRMRSVALRT
ncbi:MAG: radical SAM protein [Planctomycetota bacterium]